MANPSFTERPYDPSGETQSWRFTTNGRVNSYKWDLVAPAWATSAQYQIVTGEEATHGDSYFAVSCVVPSGYGQNGVENQALTMLHEFVSVTPSTFYTVTADIIGATIVRPTGNVPAVFRADCGFFEYDADFNLVSIGSNSTGASDASSVSTTVTTIAPGTIAYTPISALDASTRYIKPFVRLIFGDVASIPAGTTVEFRFDNLRLMGPRNSAPLNGTTPNRILLASTDPSYVSAGTDPYSLMSLTTPSIGDRIERPCYVEQIRYDVYPGNDKWTISLGLSDAITGAYWALDKSKLDVDTRLGI